MGMHMFTLDQHTIAVQRALLTCAARHALEIGGGTVPLLANAVTLNAPDGDTIPLTLAAARGMIPHLSVISAAIFGVAHGTTSSTGDFVDEIVVREGDLDEAIACYSCRSRNLHGLILRWYHIC